MGPGSTGAHTIWPQPFVPALQLIIPTQTSLDTQGRLFLALPQEYQWGLFVRVAERI